MIEKTVRDYLAGLLTAPVYLEVPEDPPETFVVLELTGAGEADRLPSAVLAVQSYAPTLYEAASLNELVRGAMDGLTGLPRVSACGLQSAYNWPDPRTKRRRYQAVYDITYKED